MLTQSSIYKDGYRSLEITYIMLKIYKLQQIFRPRIISDASTSEKVYNGEIKMYFYLAMVGFEPTPTSTAAPSNTETTHTLSATTLFKKGVIMAEVYA